MSDQLVTESFAVVDEFLPDDEFKIVQGLLRSAKLTRPPVEPLKSVWSVGGVLPYHLPSPLSSEDIAQDNSPIGKGFRLFCKRMDGILPSLAPLLGKKGSTWDRYTLSLFAYPQLSELNWHTDGRYAGGFTFFVHEHWHERWGGELLIRDTTSPAAVGSFIPALPKRLVLIKGGTPHRISTVSSEAGGHLRTALTGFFTKGP